MLYVGKVGMSVLVKGLAMDFVRQGRNEMAVTSIWPASVCVMVIILSWAGVCERIADCITFQSIESAATEHNKGSDASYKKDLRKPVCPLLDISYHQHLWVNTDTLQQTIFSDAVLAMLRAPHKIVNGLLDTDEDFLRKKCGVSDFSKYSVIPGSTPRRIMPGNFPVLEVAEQDDEGKRMDSTTVRAKM